MSCLSRLVFACAVLSALSALSALSLAAPAQRVPAENERPKARVKKAIENSIGMKLVWIPAGKFKMGSTKKEQDDAIADYEKIKGEKADEGVIGIFRAEGPQHEVEITRGLYLGAYEVTQKEFKATMGYNPSHFSTDGEGRTAVDYGSVKPSGGKAAVAGLSKEEREGLPVENVSYEEAVEFCKKLSARAKEKRAKLVYRLPSEAEWEYACRGGATFSRPYHFGDTITTSLANFGNYAEEKGALGRTCKGGSYKPNGHGLYDMHGNAGEWCSDKYGKDYYAKSPKKDPTGPSAGSYRVIRGGSWNDFAGSCRSARRSFSRPSFLGSILGFRVALVPSDGKE